MSEKAMSYLRSKFPDAGEPKNEEPGRIEKSESADGICPQCGYAMGGEVVADEMPEPLSFDDALKKRKV